MNEFDILLQFANNFCLLPVSIYESGMLLVTPSLYFLNWCGKYRCESCDHMSLDTWFCDSTLMISDVSMLV